MQSTQENIKHMKIEAPVNTIAKSWIDQLDEAIANTDEAAIWRLMEQQSSNEAAHDALTNMVSRMAYVDQQQQTVFCELFMMPVISMNGCDVINNGPVWLGVRNQVRQALGNWFNDNGTTTLFDDIAPMDWVTTWTPSVLRAHFQKAIPGNGKVRASFITESVSLPDDAPRLGFVMIVRSTFKGWRELPSANALMDQRLKEVVKYCLQIHAPTPESFMAPTPIVLAPERIQFAIVDGISLWLSKLNEVVGITGWTVMPSLRSRDVVKITLNLRSPEVDLTQFTVRLHQIGMQGLSDILSMLQQIAPMFDSPVDMPAPEHKK